MAPDTLVNQREGIGAPAHGPSLGYARVAGRLRLSVGVPQLSALGRLAWMPKTLKSTPTFGLRRTGRGETAGVRHNVTSIIFFFFAATTSHNTAPTVPM